MKSATSKMFLRLSALYALSQGDSQQELSDDQALDLHRSFRVMDAWAQLKAGKPSKEVFGKLKATRNEYLSRFETLPLLHVFMVGKPVLAREFKMSHTDCLMVKTGKTSAIVLADIAPGWSTSPLAKEKVSIPRNLWVFDSGSLLTSGGVDYLSTRLTQFSLDMTKIGFSSPRAMAQELAATEESVPKKKEEPAEKKPKKMGGKKALKVLANAQAVTA